LDEHELDDTFDEKKDIEEVEQMKEEIDIIQHGTIATDETYLLDEWGQPLDDDNTSLLRRLDAAKHTYLRTIDTLNSIYGRNNEVSQEIRQEQYLKTKKALFGDELNTTSDSDFIVKEILYTSRHTNIKKSGRVFTNGVYLLIGNGQGTAGWGYGTGKSISEALQTAYIDAQNSLITIDRFEGRTISHNIATKFSKSKVELKQLSRGSGMMGPMMFREIFQAFGLDDISGRIVGNRNKVNTYKALFKAIQIPEHPEITAKSLGKVVFNHQKVWRKTPCIYSY